jgi:glucosamine-6-phosphate deaminase
MTIRVYATPRAAASALARRVAAAVAAAPRLVLGLPAGRTPIPFYDRLVRMSRRGEVDLSRVTVFDLDEFLGLPPEHPGSYRAFLARHLLTRLVSPPQRIHLIDGTARDPERECRRYERALARAGGFDFLILGLGRNGHLGFNEPGPVLVARTHRTRLTLASRRANVSWFEGRLSQVPREALTVGMAAILQARRIAVLATGREKAPIVRRMTSGLVTPWVPASFLQLHPAVEVLLDRAAASRR